MLKQDFKDHLVVFLRQVTVSEQKLLVAFEEGHQLPCVVSKMMNQNTSEVRSVFVLHLFASFQHWAFYQLVVDQLPVGFVKFFEGRGEISVCLMNRATKCSYAPLQNN